MYREDYQLDKNSLAFEYLVLDNVIGLDDDDIIDAITDGGNDGGIDAVWIDNNNLHLFTFKYTEKFDKTKSNFPEKDINSIILTIKRIFEKDICKNDVNSLLWSKIENIYDIKGTINIKLYICSNGLKPINAVIQKLEKDLQSYEPIEFKYLGQNEIMNFILGKKYSKKEGKLTFIEKFYFSKNISTSIIGIVGLVPIIDLVQMITKDEGQTIDEEIFNDNIRLYLKLKNSINKNIYDTALSDSNETFWILNNGITIVCERCDMQNLKRSPEAHLINYQIVNGGQTMHALFDAYNNNKDKLDDVLLLVRICSTSNLELSKLISETTNSQTPIKNRDLRSNDPIQKNLEENFLDMGYYYERKKNQHQSKPKEKRLDAQLLAQLFMAYYLDMPAQAKNKRAMIYDEKYNEIFDVNSITADKMLLPYKFYLPLNDVRKGVMKKIRQNINITDKELMISRGVFHIINAVKHIAKHEQIDLNLTMNDKDIQKVVDKSIQITYEAIRKEKNEKKGRFSYDNIFKIIETVNKIQIYVNNTYAK